MDQIQESHARVRCVEASITIETNCPCGGDAGHGGWTGVSLDLRGMSNVTVVVNDSDETILEENDIDPVITIGVVGDDECLAVGEMFLAAGISLLKATLRHDNGSYPNPEAYNSALETLQEAGRYIDTLLSNGAARTPVFRLPSGEEVEPAV